MSRDRSFLRFSAINSIPSSVIFEQPDNDNTVKLGKVWTEKKKEVKFSLIWFDFLVWWLSKLVWQNMPLGWGRAHVWLGDKNLATSARLVRLGKVRLGRIYGKNADWLTIYFPTDRFWKSFIIDAYFGFFWLPLYALWAIVTEYLTPSPEVRTPIFYMRWHKIKYKYNHV